MLWADSGLKEPALVLTPLCPNHPTYSPGTCAEVPEANIGVITTGQQCRRGLIQDIQHPSPWRKVTAKMCDQLPTGREKRDRSGRLPTLAMLIHSSPSGGGGNGCFLKTRAKGRYAEPLDLHMATLPTPPPQNPSPQLKPQWAKCNSPPPSHLHAACLLTLGQ